MWVTMPAPRMHRVWDPTDAPTPWTDGSSPAPAQLRGEGRPDTGHELPEVAAAKLPI